MKVHRKISKWCHSKSWKKKTSKLQKENSGHMKLLKFKSEYSESTKILATLESTLHIDFQQKIECDTCLVNFSQFEVEAHKKTCFYTCPECPYKTKTIFGLNNHLGSHKEAQKKECDMCQTTYPPEALKDHKDACFYWCSKCPYQTKTIFGLNNHLAIHNETKGDLQNNENKSFPFETTTDVDQENHLKYHIETQESSLEFECEVCQFRTSTLDDFTMHVQNHKLHEENVYEFTCEICQFRKTTNIALENHLVLHQDTKDSSHDLTQHITLQDKPLTPMYASLDQYVSWQYT